MANCFICKKSIASGEITHGIWELGKKGMIIPEGMRSSDKLCDGCFMERSAKEIRSTIKITQDPAIQVRGVEFHDKALSPEEIKAMFERGPPNVDDRTPHIISHKDEDKGYLWIDGKKVKKDDVKGV